VFKGIDTTRPWPKAGMTTEKWKQVPLFDVDIHQLIATQDGVKLFPLIVGEPTSYCGDPHPHVVSWRGNLFLEDGHHRAVRTLIRGYTKIFARVLTIIDHGE
jgi:hypothetical protein